MAGWALSAVVTEDFLNAIAAEGVGEGIEVEGFRQSFNLPMLGPLDLGIDREQFGDRERSAIGDPSGGIGCYARDRK